MENIDKYVLEQFDQETGEKLMNGSYLPLLEISLPPSTHPNYKLWRNYNLRGIIRGREICSVLAQYKEVFGAEILDFGCGDGGHSVALAEAGAHITSIDVDEGRIERAKALASDFNVQVDFKVDRHYGEDLLGESFDFIVCNDVIEHVDSFERLAKALYRLLKPDGMFFLTAPNRFSIHNVFSDSHYKLAFVSLLSRKIAAPYVIKIRRRVTHYDVNRFLGWLEIKRLFRANNIELKCLEEDQLLERIENGNLSSIAKRFIAKIVPARLINAIRQMYLLNSWTIIGKRIKSAH